MASSEQLSFLERSGLSSFRSESFQLGQFVWRGRKIKTEDALKEITSLFKSLNLEPSQVCDTSSAVIEQEYKHIQQLPTTVQGIVGEYADIYLEVIGYMLTGEKLPEYLCNFAGNIIDVDLSGYELISDLIIGSNLFKNLRALKLSSYNKESVINAVFRLKHLRHLNLSHSDVTDVGFSAISQLENLQTIDLEFCPKVSDNCLNAFVGFKDFRVLNLKLCVRISDKGVAIISKCATLQDLNLSNCYQISKVGLGYISQISTLRRLVLDECTNISDFKQLVALQDLRYFSAKNCFRIINEDLFEMAKLPKLEELYLNKCLRITDTGLSALSKNSSLTHLNLHSCSSITGKGFKSFENGSSLLYLNLSYCRVTDQALIEIARFSELLELELESCGLITRIGLDAITQLKNLRKLNLSWCLKLCGDDLKVFSSFRSLESLNLSWCDKIRDADLHHLVSASSIVQLDLSGCSISDNGVKTILEMTRLHTIILNHCSCITEESLDAIAASENIKRVGLIRCTHITEYHIRSLLERRPDLIIVHAT